MESVRNAKNVCGSFFEGINVGISVRNKSVRVTEKRLRNTVIGKWVSI